MEKKEVEDTYTPTSSLHFIYPTHTSQNSHQNQSAAHIELCRRVACESRLQSRVQQYLELHSRWAFVEEDHCLSYLRVQYGYWKTFHKSCAVTWRVGYKKKREKNIFGNSRARASPHSFKITLFIEALAFRGLTLHLHAGYLAHATVRMCMSVHTPSYRRKIQRMVSS